MKYSKLMQERIRRTRVLFNELSFEVIESDSHEDSFNAVFEHEKGFNGSFFIDRDSKFLEVAFTFAFSPNFGAFLQEKLRKIFHIGYEYGCYLNLHSGDKEITLSIFSKVYFAGLNYYSLKETLRDFRGCIEDLKQLLEISSHRGGQNESA
jgi:hypothetical protein